MDMERFIIEFSKLNENTLIEIVEACLQKYKQTPDKYRSELICFMGILLTKLHGEPIEEVMETFKHFKNFEDLTKFTGSQ